jgi:hypothetical protein
VIVSSSIKWVGQVEWTKEEIPSKFCSTIPGKRPVGALCVVKIILKLILEKYGVNS